MYYWVNVTELFSKRLRVWRGKLYQKEAAAKLDVPLPTFRKWENGKQTPNKLALAEIERRMERNAEPLPGLANV